MNTVYKYTNQISDIVEFCLPRHAEILKVDTQDDGASREVTLWALVDTDNLNDPVYRRVRITGTGHPIEDNSIGSLKYINTFTMMEKALWFHVFEIA